VPGDYTHNYGVVRLLENPSGDNYSPTGQVWMHKLAYKVYQELALGYSITDPVDENQALANHQLYFPETGQAIAPEFAAFWLEKGGLGQFGYPISRPAVFSNGYLSQFFERAVFEYQPENAGSDNTVLLRLLGSEMTEGRFFEKADPITASLDRMYMPETGHTLEGAFLKRWQETGGLAVYGYPISEELTEASPTDGQTYVVQYFERNRFEYHPESAGTPFEIQVGLLGASMLTQDTCWR
jgi:hypothetical protein